MNQYYNDSIDGWMYPEDLKFLYDIALNAESIVEVGVAYGRTTWTLCTACKGTVYAVDHFLGTKDDETMKTFISERSPMYDKFIENCGHFKNLKIIKDSSENAVKQFYDRSVDVVFIDADHSYEEVMRDIFLWKRVCKKILCGHDAYDPDVISAVS